MTFDRYRFNKALGWAIHITVLDELSNPSKGRNLLKTKNEVEATEARIFQRVTEAIEPVIREALEAQPPPESASGDK